MVSSTARRVTKDAKFFTNMSNARRAAKKILNVDTATINAFIFVEAPEDGGRYWFSPAALEKAAAPAVEVDKATNVEVVVNNRSASPKIETAETKLSRARCEVRNGVRRPLKGKCAEVWATLTAVQEVSETDSQITIADVRALADSHGWNLNNATIEFYAWRKFHGKSEK